eukprot:gene8630-9562_t
MPGCLKKTSNVQSRKRKKKQGQKCFEKNFFSSRNSDFNSTRDTYRTSYNVTFGNNACNKKATTSSSTSSATTCSRYSVIPPIINGQRNHSPDGQLIMMATQGIDNGAIKSESSSLSSLDCDDSLPTLSSSSSLQQPGLLFLDRPSKSREQSKSSSFSNTSKDLDALIGLKLPQVEKKFREKMIQKFADVKRAFVAFDNKRDGFVTLDELKRVLINFLFPMSDQMFSQLMERCGVRASHKIPYDHFLDKFKSLGQEGNGQTIPIVPSHKVNPIREAESPLEMKEVWTRLKSHILSNYSSIKKAFLVFDDDKDGRVNRKEFRKVLKTFPFQITSEQFKEVMRRVDPDGNGYISYHQFLNTFETREGQGAHPWLSNERKVNQAIPMPAVDRQRAEDILRTKIMDNWKSIAKAFTKVDENSDGFISAKELKTLLYRFHLQISENHFKDLWARCDINSDGMIQYDEFMKQLVSHVKFHQRRN